MDLESIFSVDGWGNCYWTNRNGEYHSVDGPAMIKDWGEYWFINGKNITEQVEQWMELKQISWPFDESSQVEFLLTFL
jgi:hypothetical protein